MNALHISELELRLSAGDLRDLIEELTPAGANVRVEDLQISGSQLRARLQTDELGLRFPVDLALSVDRVEPKRLILHLAIENFGFIPPGLRQGLMESLAKQHLPRGIALEEGRLTLDMEELAWPLPATFTLADVRVEEQQVRIRLREMILAAVGPLNPQPPGPAQPVPALPAVRPARQVGEEHQPTYDQMRERIRSYLSRTLPEWMQPAVPWLLLLPDMFVLLVRLARDERVSTRAKVFAAAAVAYIALPLDIMPDFIPGIGLLDDVALALLALDTMVGWTAPEVLRAHWPGEEDVLKVVREGLEWAAQYYPSGLVGRLRNWLSEEAGKRGGGA